MFDNIGEKIQNLAIICTIIGIVASVIGAIVCWVILIGEAAFVGFLIGLGVLAGGILLSWLNSFFMYGFGELIEKTSLIARAAVLRGDSAKQAETTKKEVEE